MFENLAATLLSFITPTTVAIYIIIHLITYIVFININCKFIIKADPELNKKYQCFARNDVDKWSIIKNFPCKHSKASQYDRVHPVLAQIFYRYIDYHSLYCLGEVRSSLLSVVHRLCMIGHTAGEPLHPIRRILTKKPGQYLPRLLIFFSSIVWINVERP